MTIIGFVLMSLAFFIVAVGLRDFTIDLPKPIKC
jgi:hypothetical protein